VALGAKSVVKNNLPLWNKDAPKKEISAGDKRTGAEWCSTEYMNALCVAVPLVFEECFLKAIETAEGKLNIGYCMISMPADRKNPYGKWRKVKSSDTCTEEEAALWAAIYNQKYIFPMISKKLNVKVSCGMILALADLSYNSGALGIMLARLNDGWSERDILDKMLEYRKAKIKKKLVTLDGLIVRRWWDYAAGSNAIDYVKLLDCKLTAVSAIGSANLYSDKAKYKPIISPDKINQVLSAKVPSKPSVRDIFNRSDIGDGYIRAIEYMDIKASRDLILHESDAAGELNTDEILAFDAQSAFDAGDYANAAEKFKQLIDSVPNEYGFYNDLIFTLYKLGQYDEALVYARILIDMAHEDDVGEDKIFGAAYFNAGLCREAKGELSKARKNYVTASKRMPGNAKVNEALMRIDNKINAFKNASQKTKAKSNKKNNSRKGRDR
jgi:tetratricopeptide (TPR) repeat protein